MRECIHYGSGGSGEVSIATFQKLILYTVFTEE